MMKKQTKRILDYMVEHGSITQIDALSECGIMRLASRISDLRKDGYPIASAMVKVENRFGEKTSVKRYWIEGVEGHGRDQVDQA